MSGEKYDPGGFPEDESAGGCGIIGRERRGAAARVSQRLSLSVCENLFCLKKKWRHASSRAETSRVEVGQRVIDHQSDKIG